MSKKKKTPVRSEVLEAKVWPLLDTAVEEGVAAGFRRGDKHADDPLTERQIERLKDRIAQEVLSAIMERFYVKETSEEL